MAKNYDIKTLSKVIGTAIATLGIGAVPTGMKRYITMLRTNNISGMQNTIYVASATNSANTSSPTLASVAQKYSTRLDTDESDELPRSTPDPEHPLFSIAADKYINMITDKGNTRMFMQYFDAP